MAPELSALADTIIEEYRRRTGNEEMVASFIEKVGKSGTYSDVYGLAKKAGLNLETAIINAWEYGDEVYFDTMKDLLKKVSGPMYEDIATACEYIQTNMNDATQVKLKAQRSTINDFDLGDIAARMKNKKITDISGEMQTLGCKMVDDNEQANMDLLTNVGFEIIVTRRYDDIGLRRWTKYSEKCKFCEEREGTHRFKTTKEARNSGVFARHPGCSCSIDYSTVKPKKIEQDVHNTKEAIRSEEQEQSRKAEVKKNLKNLEQADKEKRLSNENVNQERQINIDKNNVKEVNRATNVKAYLAIDSKYQVYVSETSNLKEKGLRNIEKTIDYSLKKVSANGKSGLPQVYVLSKHEMGNNTFAAYNAVKNEMYLSEVIGNKAKTIELQKMYGFANPGNSSSTTCHEFIHWESANEYRKAGNTISNDNIKNYLQMLNTRGRIKLAQKGIVSPEQAYSISKYAGDSYNAGMFDETLTEYLVGRR